MFRNLSNSSLESSTPSSSQPISRFKHDLRVEHDHLPSDISSSHVLPICKEDTSPHLKDDYHSSSDFNMEILGPHKSLDLTSHNSIHKKTLGPHKTYRSSCLNNSTSSKSKVVVAKHIKYFHSSGSTTLNSTYISSSTSSSNMI